MKEHGRTMERKIEEYAAVLEKQGYRSSAYTSAAEYYEKLDARMGVALLVQLSTGIAGWATRVDWLPWLPFMLVTVTAVPFWMVVWYIVLLPSNKQRWITVPYNFIASVVGTPVDMVCDFVTGFVEKRT